MRERGAAARVPNAIAGLALAALAGCTEPPAEGWTGYAEGEYVYVAAGLAGTLTRLDVQRGQVVARGAPLFALDGEAEQAAREEADARLQSALAQAANTEKGRRADEIAVTRAQLAQAQAQAALAAADLERQQALVARGFVSRARTVLEQARARIAELTAALRVANLPARPDERKAAAALADAAREALRQSAWREQQKTRSAPADARVAEVYFRAGEWVQAGQPVVSLLPPANLKVRFFVPQGELGALKVGDPVSLRCDGCAAPIAARVSFVATQLEYTPPVIYSNAQRAKLVMMAEARPDPADGERLKPGQPVDVRRAAAAK
jgi:HlyD family secretion protein